jgi:molybdopterin-guanine dinucleotide biosynthesis protein A
LDVSCIALAGGKSSRLGRNKLVEYVGDRMLFHRVLDVLSRLGREIIVVTSRPSYLPDLSGYPNVKIVGDVYPGQGLPGGIYSGLAASESDYNFVVASDMPFLNDVLMRYMLEIAHGSDLVAYREGDRFEPLHAVYSRRCMGAIVKLLECRNSRILELVDFVKTRYLTPEELNRSDPNHLSFFNINTEEELRKAQAIAKGDSRILFS